MSNLIDVPTWFSFIVAVLAGVVGVVSLTEARSSTLIGGVHLGHDHPSGSRHRRVTGKRQRKRGRGLRPAAPSQRHCPCCRCGRRAPGPAGHPGSGPPGGPPLRHRLTTQPGLVSPADHGQPCWPASPAPQAGDSRPLAWRRLIGGPAPGAPGRQSGVPGQGGWFVTACCRTGTGAGPRRMRVSPGSGVGDEVVAGWRAPSGLMRNRMSVPGGRGPSAGWAMT